MKYELLTKKFYSFLLCLIFCAGGILPASVSATLLGAADDYNLFLFDEMGSTYNDTEGMVAVGGDVTVQHYSIGLKSPAAEYSLISGGDVKLSSGTVWNGGVFADGAVTIDKQAVKGDLVSNSTVTQDRSSVEGNTVENAGLPNPIDFDSAYDELSGTSKRLAGLEDTGSKTVKWKSIYFEGDDGVNIFSLTNEELANSVGIHFDIVDGATAIINVSGSYNDFSGFGFFDVNSGTRLSTDKGQNILYNFYETNTLNINRIGVIGSILAPDATFYGSSAVVHGTVIAQSMFGSSQFNYNPYIGVGLEPVPEPATMLLFSTSLVLLIGMRLRKKVS